MQYIELGKPQQNAYIERYNRTVLHEWLDQNIFETIRGGSGTSPKRALGYNNARPNMAICGIIPAMKLKLVA